MAEFSKWLEAGEESIFSLETGLCPIIGFCPNIRSSAQKW
jgi:hypothetical protein